MSNHRYGTTTLYIRPWVTKNQKEVRRDTVLSYFSAFGDVRNIRICNKSTIWYGLVEFAQAESATKALQKVCHIIAKQKVKVKVAHDKHQDEKNRLVPNDDIVIYDRHRASFLDMNDDCILEILSVGCLDAMDLCSVAETSGRLQEIACRVFTRRNSRCDIKSLVSCKVELGERILMNFGSVISKLNVRGSYRFKNNWTKRILNGVARYCSNALESLDISKCVITGNFTAKLRPIFNNLRKLSLRGCTFKGAGKELFAHCGSLVTLKLSSEDNGFILENTFPKLEEFSFLAHREYPHDFFLRHQNLKKLCIDSTKDTSVLQSIADNCKLLEDLDCEIPNDTKFNLCTLDHLRRLRISGSKWNITKAVQGWNNLKFLTELELYEINVDSEFIRTLSQVQSLRTFQLWHCTGLQNLHEIGDLHQLTKLQIWWCKIVDLDFVCLIKGLKNLKALSYQEHGFIMDVKTYLRIVAVVARRDDESKLTIHDCYLHSYTDDTRHTFSLNAHVVEMSND